MGRSEWLDPLRWGTEGWLDELLAGLAVTLALALAAYALGLLLGAAGAWAQLRSRGLARVAGDAYGTIGRCMPELLFVFLVYYGGSALLARLSRPFGAELEIGSFLAGVIALGVVTGAFATEVLRAAFLSVDAGQSDAAAALGLRRLPTFRLVVGPQLVGHALPGLGNLWIALLKETAVVSVIGLEDLLRYAGIAAGVTRQPFTLYGATGALYVLLALASVAVIGWLDREPKANGRR